MRDLLSMVSSAIIILFCFSLLLVSGAPGADNDEVDSNVSRAIGIESEHPVTPQTILFTKIQSVKVRKGILIFVTFENNSIKEYYFQIRDKNVIFVRDEDSEMPLESIKFTDRGCHTLMVTIPKSLEIDLVEEMAGVF
ncbi:MAG: hypothetical protein K0U86_07740 [Planctomycetes bacterium]|nr:hypothetical protein [Planctomycetota bacterium]MCH9724779.1 hypothetical protein [Planctomycetota bacterium]MCH9778719.1 hypothetical protein [Planctomycetota bacterium]